ncbi:MAG: hypothetical protein U0822_17475 [Anaerolineae bacterium]
MNTQKPNPFLSAALYGLTHFDPGQSDTFPYHVKRGTFRVDPTQQPRISGGPVNIMNLASTDPNYMWACATDRIAYVDCSNGQWRLVAEVGLPGVRRVGEARLQQLIGEPFSSIDQVETVAMQILGEHPEMVTSNGLYTVADCDNTVYVNSGAVISAIGLKDSDNPAAGLEVKRTLDTTTFFTPMAFPGYPPAVRLIGMSMTYDGHLIIGAFNGIAVIDREFKTQPLVYNIEQGQFISNSFAVDENNGIYVASGSFQPRADGILRKLIWTGSGLSDAEEDGAWSSPYDGGDWAPAVKAGTGTGATPTLMGFGPDEDHLVVLTDGLNRMKIVAFWRDNIPADFEQKAGAKSRRIADQFQITAGLPADTAWIQSEQSVAVNGMGAFVVNNMVPKGHKDKLVDVLANGPAVAPPHGMERVAWDSKARSWRAAWTRGDVASTSMVPVASSASNLVFVNGYSKEDGWQVTGLDCDTGEVVHRTIFGSSNLGNGAYALIQFLANGDLLFNSVAGPMRVRLV